MAIGLTYHPGLTAPSTRRATLDLRSRLTPRAVMAALAGIDLLALVGLAMVFAAKSTTWWVLCFPAASVALLAAYGHFEVRVTMSLAREVKSLVACTSVPLVVLALARVAPTTVLLGVAALGSVSLLVLHSVSYRAIRSMRAHGVLAERTLIVGAGKVGVTLASTLEQHPEYGLRPVGFLDHVDGEDLPLPLFGGVELLRMVLSEERIDRVIVAFGVTREWEMLETIRACESAGIDIHVLPRFFELGVAVDGNEIDDVWGIPLVRLRRSRLRRWAWFGKRALDASVAGAALVLLSPVYGLLALGVKLSSPGPVHFRQKRVGQHDSIVEVLKFRTMRVADGTDTEWSAAESRVTKIGGLMRRTSLDELPQLWNIIRGQMSLVGPRPERPYFVERFKGEVHQYGARHRVPIGLTGLAQIHGLRGDTSIAERARFDNRYIETWSLWRDMVILVQTFFAVVRDAVPSRKSETRMSVPSTFEQIVPIDDGGELVPVAIGRTSEIDREMPRKRRKFLTEDRDDRDFETALYWRFIDNELDGAASTG